MNEMEGAALAENIQILRKLDPSVLLVKCLLIGGLKEEAMRISIELIPSQMAHAHTPADGLTLDEWTELQLRAIFCNSVAGYRHNAKVLMKQIIGELTSAAHCHDAIPCSVLARVAIGGILTGDDECAETALKLVEPYGGFAWRLLSCWASKSVARYQAIADELRTYIAAAKVPPWADTWHHVLVVKLLEIPGVVAQ